ncbi:MAG: molybdate ABC transporter substrate-binding protein [Sneathiella sp.]|nr:molybdate ABC transporter substrate-binding protein [Sneathiella sp.]
MTIMPSSAAWAVQDDVVVFAAASTANVITAAAQEFEKRTGFSITASFAGSGTLARQIKEGAPANIFISANMKWLDYLTKAGLLEAGGSVEIASNQLVLIAPKDTVVPDPFDLGKLPSLLASEFLAIGNPESVPVGAYTKSAFQSLNIWDELKGKYVQLPNVRAVLSLVERAEVPFAVVYATDAQLSKKVQIVTSLPQDAYPRISYGMAMIKGNGSHAAKLFFDFVRSKDGQDIFHRFGFITTNE